MKPDFLRLLAAALAWPLSAFAGIEFTNPTQTVTVKPADKEVHVNFDFRVTGNKAVTIKDIRTFCTCLKAQPKDNRMVWAAGESGVIETAFEVGNFEGEVKKEVAVLTDEPGAKPVTLTVKISIPAIFKLEPSQVYWQVGEPAEAKTVRFTVLGDEPIHITNLQPSRAAMKAALKPVTPGKEYEIQLIPEKTDNAMLGLVRVETDAKYPRYQKRMIFFNITKKKPGEPGGPPADPQPAAQASAGQ